MCDVVETILNLSSAAKPELHVINWLLGEKNAVAIKSGKKKLVLYGSGSLGSDLLYCLEKNGLIVSYICVSQPEPTQKVINTIQIITPEFLFGQLSDSIVLIGTLTHAADIKKMLIKHGFPESQIAWPHDFDVLKAQFFTRTCQVTLCDVDKSQLIEKIQQDAKSIQSAYDLFTDQKSRDVFVEKLAAMLNPNNIGIFYNFIAKHSEPYKKFGCTPFKSIGGESYFYFSNDVFKLFENEVYVDVGAFWGDTVIEFVDACRKQSLDYSKIYAFEPDPISFSALKNNVRLYKNVICEPTGVYSKTEEMRFARSDVTPTPGGAGFDKSGDIKVRSVSLDEYFHGRLVTLIKMDPPGDIIPEALKGAAKLIKQHKPKLAIGAYHSFSSIYQIPNIIHGIRPDYNISLRHNSWYIGETDVLAF